MSPPEKRDDGCNPLARKTNIDDRSCSGRSNGIRSKPGREAVRIRSLGTLLMCILVVGVVFTTATTLSVSADQSQPERLWRVSLPENTQTVELADVDGDRVEEVTVASTKLETRTTFGVVEAGKWSWCVHTDAAVHAATSGDINGDGADEAVFRAKYNGSWVRPYAPRPANRRVCSSNTDTGYLWHGHMKAWPDETVATNFDEDERAEVVAVSNRRGFLTVWDDDGETLWEAHNSTQVEGMLGVRDVVSDTTPELLTHAPRGDGIGTSQNGLQLVRRANDGGVTQVWKYRTEEPFVATFIDQNNSSTTSVIGVSLDTGRVHAINAHNGTSQWTEATGLSEATDATVMQRGNDTPIVVIWRGSTVHHFDISEKMVTERTLNTNVRTAHPFAGGVVIVTDESIKVVNHELETITSLPAEQAVKDVETGDIDDDRHAELVVGYETELVAYDLPAVRSSSTPSQPDQSEDSSPSSGDSSDISTVTSGDPLTPTTGSPDTVSSPTPPPLIPFRPILGALGVGFILGFFMGNTENSIFRENLAQFVAFGSVSTVGAAIGSLAKVLRSYGYILASLSAGLTAGMIGGLLVRNKYGSVLSGQE